MLAVPGVRRRRCEWPDRVRQDPEVQELDEENGEWILCRTCAEHYERTHKGREPNDPKGFKIKMNGKYREAAWIMHKSRVLAHRNAFETEEEEQRRQEVQVEIESRRSVLKRRRVFYREDEIADELMDGDNREKRNKRTSKSLTKLVHLPTTGWHCPGIVPDGFYREHVKLVHAFAKYYVGAYRVNVVRDLRSDKVMLFSHDCENRVIHRERPDQPDSCERCCSIWLHNKSFKRILKKMDRYTLVEDILRHSWSVSTEELSVLSKFKHSSDMNLNLEGRKLKQAAITAVQHFSGPAKSLSQHNKSSKTNVDGNQSEGLERTQQPLSMDVMLQLHSMGSSVHDEGDDSGVSELLQAHAMNSPQQIFLNGYFIQQSTQGTPINEQASPEGG